jgi:ATP-dependent Lon protease
MPVIENESELEKLTVPDELPLLPLRGIVVFPSMVIPITVGRARSTKLVDGASLGNRIIGVVTQKDSQVQEPTPDDLYKVGTAVQIIKMFKMPDNTIQLLIQGFSRIIVKDVVRTDPYFVAQVKGVEIETEDSPEVQALSRNILATLEKIASLSSTIGNELYTLALNIRSASRIADLVASALNLPVEQEQEFLETFDVKTRLEKLTYLLNKELQLSELSTKIQSDIRDKIDKTQKEYILREQLKAIKKEL